VMKAEGVVVRELLRNLRKWRDEFFERIDGVIDKIACAETVEDVMRYKKSLLLVILDYMPLDAKYCYFCIVSSPSCGFYNCPYAKFHGVCSMEDSDYWEIRRNLFILRELVNSKYYSGEKYES